MALTLFNLMISADYQSYSVIDSSTYSEPYATPAISKSW